MAKVYACLCLILAVVITTSCGTQAGASQSLPPTEITRLANPALELLFQSATAMDQVRSYHFVTKLKEGGTWEELKLDTGPKAFIEGDFAFPDKERFVKKSSEGDRLELVRIGDVRLHRWSNFGAYEHTPWPFLDNELPGRNIINDMLAAEAASIQGEETIDGRRVTYLTFRYDGTEGKLAYPADVTGVKDTTGHVWIEQSTNLVQRYEIFRPGEKAPGVSVVFSKFDEPVVPSIELPDSP